MKKKTSVKVIALLLAICVACSISTPIKSVRASAYDWMKTAREIKLNSGFKTYNMLDDKYNYGDTYGNSRNRWCFFYFKRPVNTCLKYEIRVGTSGDVGYSLYNAKGEEIAFDFSGSIWGDTTWTYDRSSNEMVLKYTGTKVQGGDFYIGIDARDAGDTYVRIKLTPTIPGTERISSIKKTGANSVTMKWSKTTGASGYEIYRATAKKGKYTKIKTITGNKQSCTLSSIVKNKTYYYKVKAYKYMNGKKYYSYSAPVKSYSLR